MKVYNGNFVKPKNFNIYDGAKYIKSKAVHHFDGTRWVKDWSSAIPLKDLPIGTRVKFIGSNDRFEPKFIIVDKNHQGYPSNSVTLVSKYVSKSRMSSAAYWKNGEIKSYLDGYYDYDIPIEVKRNILYTSTKGFYGNNNRSVYTRVFPLGVLELDDSHGGEKYQYHIPYFSSGSRRIKTNIYGSKQWYWTRDSYLTRNTESWGVYSFDGSLISIDNTDNRYVVCAMNLKGDTIVSSEPDTDGYYIIQEG